MNSYSNQRGRRISTAFGAAQSAERYARLVAVSAPTEHPAPSARRAHGVWQLPVAVTLVGLVCSAATAQPQRLPSKVHALISYEAAWVDGVPQQVRDYVGDPVNLSTGNSTICEGAVDEDEDREPWLHPSYGWTAFLHWGSHFWDPAGGHDGGRLDAVSCIGLDSWSVNLPPPQNAYQRARELFDDAVLDYQAGRIQTAYYKLGLVSHLIVDVSTPAHVHLDPHLPSFCPGDCDRDSYENYMSQYEGRLTAFEHDFPNPSAPVNPNVLWNGGYPAGGDLYKLFYHLATRAATHDSDDVYGTSTHHVRYYQWPRWAISDGDSSLIAVDLVPKAIAYTAALYRVFWYTAHGEPDDCEPNNFCGSPCFLHGLTSPLEMSDLSIGPYDEDWYYFCTIQRAGPDDFVRIEFANATGDLDMCLYAWPNCNDPLECSTGTSDFEEISLNTRPGGCYLIQVYGYNDAINDDYTLRIHPPAGDSQLGNDLSIDHIDWDDNGANYNGHPECGEDVAAKIWLRSAADVTNVSATLIDGIHAEIYDPEGYYGSIPAGGSAVASFAMNLSPCDGSRVMSFALPLRYRKYDYQYRQTLFFTKAFPDEITHSFAVCGSAAVVNPQDDCNSDGILQSGDEAQVRFGLRNIGEYVVYDVEAAVGPCDVAGFHVENDNVNYMQFGDIAPGECAWPEDAQDHWRIDVDKNVSGTCYMDVLVIYQGIGDGDAILIPDGIEITAEPQAWMRVWPRRLDFGISGTGEAVDVETQVHNNGSADLQISGTSIVHPDGITVTITPPLPWPPISPGTSQTAVITLDPNGYEGTLEPPVEVIFQTDACWDTQDAADRVLIEGLFSDAPSSCDLAEGRNPDCSGDWIAWMYNGDIYAQNLVTHEQRPVCTEPHNQAVARISGGLVAWNDLRNWDGQTNTNVSGIDVYGYDLATGQQFPVATQSWSERVIGVDGTLIAVARAYCDFTGEDTNWDAARKLVVYEYLGAGQLTVRYESPWSCPGGHNPTPDVTYEGDFGDGLLVFEQQEIFWNSQYGYWDSRNQHLEVIDFALGQNAPQPANVSGWSNNYGASTHSFVYTRTDTDRNDQVWLWNQGVSRQITADDNDHGQDDLAIGGGLIVYDKRNLPLFYWDLADSTEHLLAEEDARDARMDGKRAVWMYYGEAGPRVHYAFLQSSDIAVTGVSFSDESPTEQDVFNVDVAVRNLSSYASTGDIRVRLYHGDPDAGGEQVAEQLMSGGLAAHGQATVAFVDILAPPVTENSEQSHEFCVRITAGTADNPCNNTACATVVVQDSDIDGPDILDVRIEEYAGYGDGVIADDEQVRISWRLSDPSSISSTELHVDTNPVPLQGDYYAIVGPLSEGPHEIVIGATDDDLTPESSEEHREFDVEDAACLRDGDGDGVVDCDDNCPGIFNPGQEDNDSDEVGDACDPAPGDMNCDGGVDFDDINPFVRALVGQAVYEGRHPECRWLNGDIDGDGDVNFDDIRPFVRCLVNAGCP